MKEELTFEDLISDLKENGVETSIKGGFKFTEMVHEESQKLMKVGSSSSHIEIPAKVANLFTDFIIKSVELEDDVVDINNLFIIANMIQYFKPDIKLTYHTYRTELPTEELNPETFFSGVPFDKVELKNTFVCLT